ncbi:hypothetical protein NQ314_004880 [Rhamnusium bicolor]|uniref:Gustatory receptor n=1 Tax=Rhamnusium bicolor TaxID=1586634 RepID=A0AAV8ZI73_9CUCU|nr:hypothetical protein NQ314_004880 [Rhamnusium bicolor]
MYLTYVYAVHNVCNILCIAPLHDFKGKKISRTLTFLHGICSIFLLAFRIYLLVYKILTLPVELRDENSTTNILECMTNFAYWLLPFSTVFDLLFRTKNEWKCFLDRARKIDKCLRETNLSNEKQAMIVVILCVVLNSVLFARTGWDVYNNFYISNRKMYVKILTIIYNMEEFVWLYSFLLTNNVILFLGNQGKQLNYLLNRIISETVENKFKSSNTDYFTVKQIKLCKSLYMEMEKISRSVNVIFGWPGLCIMLSFLNILEVLNSVIFGARREQMFYELFELALTLVYSTVLIISYEYATNEGQKLIHLCYDLEEKFPLKSPIRNEVLEFVELTKYFAPKFSAVGLFIPSRKTILNMFSLATTYLIVIIQLNSY